MFTFFWKCLQWSCLKAVSVPTFVIGGLQGSTASSGAYCPHQAVGLGAPQTIIRRLLSSPDRHDNLVHAGYSCGRLGASSWPTFFYRLHVCNFQTGILQCTVKNVLTKSTHRSPRNSSFFLFRNYFSPFLF